MPAHTALAYTAWMLVQLLSAPHALFLPTPFEEDQEENNQLLAISDGLRQPMHDPLAEM